MNSKLTVKQFIDILTKEVAEEDRDIAEIDFFIKRDGKEIDLDIVGMSGFSIDPDIVIELEEVEKPIISPAKFKQSFIKNQKTIDTDIEFRGKMSHHLFK